MYMHVPLIQVCEHQCYLQYITIWEGSKSLWIPVQYWLPDQGNTISCGIV